MSLIESFKEVFAGGSSAGIYWDGSSLGIVQVSGSHRSLEIDRVAYVPLKEDSNVAAAIKETVSREGFRFDRLVSAVPASEAMIRELPVAFTDLKKLRKTLRYQVEPYISCPAEEIVADCVTPFHDARLISVALQKHILTEHLSILRSAGLSPDITGISEIALFYLYEALHPPREPGVAAIVHILHNRTGVQIIKDGRIELFRVLESSPFSVDRLNQTLKTWKLTGNGDVIREVLVTGPFAAQEKIAEEISQAVEADAVVWQPFEELNCINARLGAEYQSDLCIPLGLAVMGMMNSTEVINLQKEEFEKSKGRGLKTQFLTLFFSLLVFLSLVFTNFYQKLHGYQAEYDRLGRSIIQVFNEAFPGATRPLKGREASQMRQKVAEEASQYRWAQEVLSGKASLDTILSFSNILSAYPEIIIDQMTIEDKRVSFGGHTNSFSSLDRLKEALTKNVSFSNARLTGTKMDKKDNSIAFQFSLEAAS